MATRMRTASGALEVIKELDPETAVTLHYIRKLINSGKISHVDAGRKKLVNVDRLMEYLSQTEREAQA